MERLFVDWYMIHYSDPHPIICRLTMQGGETRQFPLCGATVDVEQDILRKAILEKTDLQNKGFYKVWMVDIKEEIL